MSELGSKVTSWDKGIPYHIAKRKILHLLKYGTRKQKAYAAILLIQLRNGSRISEAVRAAKKFLETGKRKLRVRISKKKRPETRLMIIPEPVSSEILAPVSDVSEKQLVDRCKMFAIRQLGINTHSLRYSFVTNMLEKGVEATIIAKITGHSKLDYILRYTQKKRAEELLELYE